jgi:hypothetical protein
MGYIYISFGSLGLGLFSSAYIVFIILTCLRSGGGLHIVALQVALEVQDGYLLRLRYRQKLAQSGIRVDVLLVVQAVLLHILHDAAGHIRAGHQGALGLAQEHAQSISNHLGLGEDGGLLGQGVAGLIHLRGAHAAAAAGTLELTAQALLGLLHVSQHGAQLVAQLVYTSYLAGELSHQGHLLLSGHGCCRGGSQGGSGSRGRGSLSGRCLGGSCGGGSHGGGGYGLLGRSGLLCGCGRRLLGGSGTHLYLLSGFFLWLFNALIV